MFETIAFFPVPYKDEDFRSIVHRYHIRSGNPSFKLTKLELLNFNTHKNLHFPRNLDYLINKLPKDNFISKNKIINEHTVFPIIKPFISMDRLPIIFEDLGGGTSRKTFNVGGLLGRRSNKVIHEKIHYCPECLTFDDNNFGEVFVHRLHQISFLKHCPTHKKRLLSKCPICNDPLSKSNDTKLITTPYCFNGHKLYSEDSLGISNVIQLMIKNIDRLINYSNEINKNIFVSKLKFWLKIRGYSFGKNKIDRKRFIFDLLRYASIDLEELNLSSDYINSKDVYTSLMSQEIISDMRLNLLVIQFLVGSVDDFFYGEYDVNLNENKLRFDIEKLAKTEILEGFKEVSATVEKVTDIKSKNRRTLNLQNFTLDWVSIDIELSAKIKKAANKAYRENQNTPIKKNTIIRYLSSLERGRIRRTGSNNILPISNRTLEEYVETLEDYLIKKIPMVIRQLKRKGCKNITFKTIVSHRPIYKDCSQKVINEIEKKLLMEG
ncbi:TniQ family protein [Fredinandcohnia sp. QZ13]|uniref:TniQ family protein n=1 Tax=Fredinandcohnia sp. QZ13 TaxID=3073144 RepID=UPI00285337F3|nr:TniQ family protein [Fredinandcohnia sp. QZ13]MDR4888383.1 TniQ family protein [Fredinandcohnia sp. QZ13]